MPYTFDDQLWIKHSTLLKKTLDNEFSDLNLHKHITILYSEITSETTQPHNQ